MFPKTSPSPWTGPLRHLPVILSFLLLSTIITLGCAPAYGTKLARAPLDPYDIKYHHVYKYPTSYVPPHPLLTPLKPQAPTPNSLTLPQILHLLLPNHTPPHPPPHPPRSHPLLQIPPPPRLRPFPRSTIHGWLVCAAWDLDFVRDILVLGGCGQGVLYALPRPWWVWELCGGP